MLRKNGKPSSCEPCRLSKIKCDHEMPICIKCQSRGMIDKCFYHPNPLTKTAGTPRKKTEARRRRPDAHFIAHVPRARPAPLRMKPLVSCISTDTDPTIHRDNTSLQTQASPLEVHQKAPESRTSFYLGSTSYANMFSESQRSSDDTCRVASVSMTSTPPIPSGVLGSRFCRIDIGHTIISMLLPFSFIERSLHMYSHTQRASALVNPLILSALPQLRHDVEQLIAQGGNSHITYAKMIENTSQAFIVPSSMLPSAFHNLFTGENLRWEILGLVLAIAGYNAQYTSPDDPIFTLSDGQKLDKDKFIADAIHATNDCISLCRAHGAINDIMVMLNYVNLYMVANFYGDNYHGTWQRLSDCISALYAAGMHYEGEADDNGNGEPLFLREARRRMQSACYRSDKTLATFFGRPPLMSGRYCGRKPPLNLSDEVITDDDPSVVSEAIAGLNDAGWDAEGRIHPTSFIRLRGQYAVFKERLLELSLVDHQDDDKVQSLQSTLKESQDFWDSLPKRIRYDLYDEDEAWSGPEQCSTMGLILPYLEYLHIPFQALRLLNRITQQTLPELLEVSQKLLSTSLTFVKPNGRMYEAQRHFPTAVLFYCFPAAGALALELRKHMIEGISLPSTVSRADIIRNLSVLTSSLEWIILPGDGNRKLCTELNKMLALVLEEVLNYEPPVNPGSGDVLRLADPGAEFFDMPLIDGMNPIPTETEDFLSWLENATWDNTNLF